MIRFVPMTPELFAFLPPRADFGLHDLHVPAVQLHVCAAPNVALAMLDDGRVMAAGGVAQVWPGRGVAWFLPGEWMERRHYARALFMCEAHLGLLASAGMRRVECAVLAGVARRKRWALRLGFAEEGCMRSYGPDGADHLMMARCA